MAFNPRDALDAAKDIATHTVDKSSDIVENAGDILRGDIAGGTGEIVQNSLDIVNHAVDRIKEVFTGSHGFDDGE
jgi:hypothetical protein